MQNPYPRVVKMTDLVSSMTAAGITDVKQATKKHVRSKLEAEFGDTLVMCADSSRKLYVFQYKLTLQQLAVEHQEIKQELEITRCKSSDMNSVLTSAVFHLR